VTIFRYEGIETMKTRNLIGAVLCGTVSLLAAGGAQAAVLALYEFQSGSLLSTDADANSTASPFASTGLADLNQGNAFSFLDTDIAGGDFLSFTVTPTGAGTLELTTFSFSGYRLGAGTTAGTVQVYSSLDAFASALNIFNTSTFTSSTTQTLDSPSAAGLFVDVSNPLFDTIGPGGVEFRFFFTGSTDGPPNRRNAIDDITVTGTAVPLPAPVLLLGSALAGLVLVRRRPS
jgi:hypothetical protein